MPDTSANPPTTSSSIQASPTIPLLDLSAGVVWRQERDAHLNSAQAAPRDVIALSADLSQALHEVGVIYISGHGVSRAIQRDIERSARMFFSSPSSNKRSIEMKRAGRAWRGYFAEGAELTAGLPDYKEGLYFGEEHAPTHPLVRRSAPMHGANQWPQAPQRLRPDVLAYCREMKRVATLLIELISLGLGLSADALLRRFTCVGTQEPTQLFRIFHYPRHSWSTRDDKWGVRAHTDMGFLTVLLQDQEGGLQAQLRSGAWVDVPPKEDTFVVNIGDMLELWTWGYLRATLHRVKSPVSKGGEAGRLSFPYFFDPAWDAPLTRIDRSLLPARSTALDTQSGAAERWDGLDLGRLNAETTYGDFVWRKVSQVFPHLAQM